jgi:hypothetical protein
LIAPSKRISLPGVVLRFLIANDTGTRIIVGFQQPGNRGLGAQKALPGSNRRLNNGLHRKNLSTRFLKAGHGYDLGGRDIDNDPCC